jgi:hypothetical protein
MSASAPDSCDGSREARRAQEFARRRPRLQIAAAPSVAALLLLTTLALPTRARAAVDSTATGAPRLHAFALATPAPDRLLHGSLSLSLGLGVGLGTRSSGAAFGSTVALGLLKEWRDTRHTHFDGVDLAFDVAGATLAAILTRGLAR